MPKTRIRWFNALLHSGPGYETPTRTETDLLAGMDRLATRYEEIAEKVTSDVGRQHAGQITRAARDIRHVLAHGHIPAYLMTDTELEQHAAREEAGR